MREKRLFEILDEMNQDDIKENSKLVEIGNTLISGDKVKAGCKISMGMPESALHDIMTDKKIPILVLVDRDEYFKRKLTKVEK